MALTKTDLRAIDNIVTKRVKPLEKGQSSLEKSLARLETGQAKMQIGIIELDNKFIKLFDFLDRDWSTLKKRVDYHDRKLGVDSSEIDIHV